MERTSCSTPGTYPPISMRISLVDVWMKLPMYSNIPGDSPGSITPFIAARPAEVSNVPEPFRTAFSWWSK